MEQAPNQAKLELDAQIAREREELLSAPRIELNAGTVIRCHFCGQPTTRHRVETYKYSDGAVERVRGACCGA